MKKKVVEKPKAKASVKKPVVKKAVQNTPSLPQSLKPTGSIFEVRFVVPMGTVHLPAQVGSWDEVIEYLKVQNIHTRQGVKQIEVEFKKAGVS